MHLVNFVAIFLPLSTVLAVPGRQQGSVTTSLVNTTIPGHYNASSTGHFNATSGDAAGALSTTTIDVNTTVTVAPSMQTPHGIHPNSTATANSSSMTSTPSTWTPLTAPTNPVTVVATRSNSPIHLLAMNAAGRRFYLGGHAQTYCPESVQEVEACPVGDTTALFLCGMVSLLLSLPMLVANAS
jgi:hypothetical protein